MAGNWMQWLQGLNTGAPGGPMGPGMMPQPGGMPPPGMPMGGGGMPPPVIPPGGGPTPGDMPTIPPPGAAMPPPGPAAPAGPAGPQTQDQMMMNLYTRLGALQPQQAKLSRQQALAEGLRQGGRLPEMRSSGRMMHAASPWEALGALGSSLGSAYMGRRAEKTEAGLGTARSAALQKAREQAGFKD